MKNRPLHGKGRFRSLEKKADYSDFSSSFFSTAISSPVS